MRPPVVARATSRAAERRSRRVREVRCTFCTVVPFGWSKILTGGQAVMPVTEVPDRVTWYFAVAPELMP
ncbi:hypothetical protein KCMC57_up07710 [Kitasatospora sp. CMC57]|uniref:Uncharacterized protein n=1 Tax=Kitasatospora sp. CMC57 TaxID=3231513 RepID=A0AB33JSX6_9ACTN